MISQTVAIVYSNQRHRETVQALDTLKRIVELIGGITASQNDLSEFSLITHKLQNVLIIK